MGIALQHGAVHVGAGLPFVGIADDILGVGRGLPCQTPFLGGGRGRAAAAREDPIGPPRGSPRRASSGTAGTAPGGAAGRRLVQVHRIDRPAIAENDLLLTAIEIQVRPFADVAELLGARLPAGRGGDVDFTGRDMFFAAEAAQGRLRLQVSARGIGGQQPAWSYPRSFRRSSPAVRRATRGPAAAPWRRSRCSRCGRRRHPV